MSEIACTNGVALQQILGPAASMPGMTYPDARCRAASDGKVLRDGYTAKKKKKAR